MAMRYSADRITYTIHSSQNIDAAYPASRIVDVARPFRVSRSSNTGGTFIVLDLGSVQHLATVSIENANFTTCELWGSIIDPTTPGFNWAVQTPYGPLTLAVDQEDGRRKCRVAPDADTRWIYVNPQSPVTGATYFEIGAIGCWSTLTTLAKSVGLPYEKTPQVASDSLEYESGAVEMQALGPAGLVIATSTANIPRNSAAHDQYATLARTPRDRIVLWDENEGDASKMYHAQVTETWEITRGPSYIDVTGIRLTQTV